MAPGPLLLVSPHLDDAILSCWCLLTTHPGVEVVTVFAGEPSPPERRPWDLLCGFSDSREAAVARHAEDDAAFAGLGVRRMFLPLLDNQYTAGLRSAADRVTVRSALTVWLASSPGGGLALPAGAGARPTRIGAAVRGRVLHRPEPSPAPHPDHLWVRDEGVGVARETGSPIVLYEELPYLYGGRADREVARVASGLGGRAELVTGPVDRTDKARRIGAYPSQIPHLQHPDGPLDAPGSLPTRERWWRLPGRLPRVGALAALTVAGLLAPGFGGGSEAGAATPTALGLSPASIALGPSDAWAVGRGGPLGQSVPLRAGRPAGAARAVPLARNGMIDPVDVSSGPAGTWVADGSTGRLARVTRGRVTVALTACAQCGGVAVAARAVWVTDRGRGALLRVSTGSRPRVTARLSVGRSPVGVAVGAGAVWVAANGDGAVVRVDPSSGRRVGAPVPVGAAPTRIAVGAGSAWVAGLGAGSVTRLTPDGARVRSRAIRVGGRPVDLAYEAGALWIADLGGRLLRLDPTTGRVRVVRRVRGGAVTSVASSSGAVWFGSTSPPAITRLGV